MTQGKIFFAHPKNTFGTGIEHRALHALYTDGWDVLNPADHQAGYAEKGMAHFLELVGECEAIAYMSFEDGALGAGVAREILEAHLLDRGVFRIDPHSCEITRDTSRFSGVLSISQTRERLAA
jgi:hypothetical protein